MKSAICLVLLCGFGIWIASPAHSHDAVDSFVARTFARAHEASLSYRLYVPAARSRRQPLPAIIFLHGIAGSGSDNLAQITGGNRPGSHFWTTSTAQSRHPAFVIAPQLPPEHTWSAADSTELSPYASLVLQLLDQLSKEYAIDANRIYVVGQSLGGQGVWDLISKHPERFAAAVPLCGSGNPGRIAEARSVAVWAFHGALDPVVSVDGSRVLVAALRAAGASVQYTEYPDVGHEVWNRAFADPQLADWLFSQRRTR